MAVTAALSPSSLPQSSTGRLEVRSVLAYQGMSKAIPSALVTFAHAIDLAGTESKQNMIGDHPVNR